MNPYESPTRDEPCQCPLDHWAGIVLLTISVGGILAFGVLLGAVVTGWAR